MTLFTVTATIFLLLSVAGGVFFIALVHVRKERLEREARIHLVVRAGAATGAPLELDGRSTLSGGDSAMARHLRGIFAVRLSHNWGMHAGVMTLCIMAFGGSAAVWLLLSTALHFSVATAGGCTAAAFFLAPRMWLKHEQNAADQKFVALFPDAIDMMIRMLRAGLPVTAAIRAVGAEAAPPVNQVFSHIADQMGIGIAFEDALAVAGEQIGLPDFRFFAVSISLQRATGGNLAVTLDILSDIMRKRRAMRLKGRAVTGEVRMSAYVLGALPFLVIGGLLLSSPDYLQPLISDRRGNIIVGVAVLLLLIGFGTIRQMMRSVTKV